MSGTILIDSLNSATLPPAPTNNLVVTQGGVATKISYAQLQAALSNSSTTIPLATQAALASETARAEAAEAALPEVPDLSSPCIAYGLALTVPTLASLSGTVTAGAAYVGAVRVSVSAFPIAFASSSDSYIDLTNDGVLHVLAVANGASPPAVTSGALRLMKVVTGTIQAPVPVVEYSTASSSTLEPNASAVTCSYMLVGRDGSGHSAPSAAVSVDVANSVAFSISWIPGPYTAVDIYRSTGGAFGLIAAGASQPFVDNGSISPGAAPPTSATGTIQSIQTISVLALTGFSPIPTGGTAGVSVPATLASVSTFSGGGLIAPPASASVRNFSNASYGLTSYQPYNGNFYNIRCTVMGTAALSAASGSPENTAIGFGALQFSTSNANTAVGSQALNLVTTGPFNTAVGSNAGRSLTTGSGNVALGHGAMGLSDTAPVVCTGSDNSALGSWSLQYFQTGSGNTAAGKNAMLNLVSGNNNVAIGRDAFSLGTAGATNGLGAVAIGHQALQNTSAPAEASVAIGDGALLSNTTGASHVAIGTGALGLTTTNSNSTAVGDHALQLATGGDNTAVGSASGQAVTTGIKNATLGSYAGYALTTASGSVMLGQACGFGTTTGGNNTYVGFQAGFAGNYTNSIAIGANAQPTSNNQTVIGNSSTTQTQVAGNLFSSGFSVSTMTVKSNFVLSKSNTSGTTFSATDLFHINILRTGPTGAFTDITDTATNILAMLPGVAPSYGVEVAILNQTSFAQTIAGGSGVLMVGTATIAANTGRRFVLYVSADATYPVYMQNVGSYGA